MISDNMTQKKTHYFMTLFGQRLFRNSVAMATPKVPGDQKLFARLCYILKLKVTKFHLHIPNSFLAVFKKTAGSKSAPPPPHLNVNNAFKSHLK